jgi:PhzF family phenazine biosynthesis protein
MSKIYQVDAFTGLLFSGNPAAVCPLNEWPDDQLMQNIALENNLAETAFYVKRNNEYELRWFTPAVEVALCGHATLATAFVLFNYENHQSEEITFSTRQSGKLIVRKEGEYLILNFPTDTIEPVDITDEMTACFHCRPIEAFRGKTDHLLIFENESQIRNNQPDLNKIKALFDRGVIVTAKGDEADFVSRFFAPNVGIDEDPVTGSAHTSLTPYWSSVLGKIEMTALQLSKRGGFLKCRNLGDRVEISGKAKLYMIGEITTA